MSFTIEHLASYAARSAMFAGFVNLLERIDTRRSGLLRVLTYHRVDDPDARPDLDPAMISATRQGFAEQMAFLATAYRPVSIAEVLAAAEQAHTLPPRAVLVTFDDAYRDFAAYAWPVLKRHGIPAALFVPTSFPDRAGRAFWWDRLHQALRETVRIEELSTPCGRLALATPADRTNTARRLREHLKTVPHVTAMALIEAVCDELDAPPPTNEVLGWDELRALAREGVALGAHTRNHPLLDRLDVAEAATEAVESVADLRREIVGTPPIFAYPGGHVTDAVVDALRRAGVALAFVTRRGINDLRAADPLRLRRVNVSRHTTPLVFRAKLLPGVNRWRRYAK